jgi:NADP-dependent 3-hydroxy acid dehydrogenase YdfG
MTRGRRACRQSGSFAGASRGLGRAFAEEALRAGRVLATARNSEHLVGLASNLERVCGLPLDVTNEAEAKYAVEGGPNCLGAACYED